MVTEATAATAIEARATATVEVKVAMAGKADTVPLMTPDLLLQALLLTKTLNLPITLLSMPSGPLTMLRTRLKIPTPPMEVSPPSWLSTRKQGLLVLVPQQAMVSTMVKVMVKHSLLHLVRVYLHHRQISPHMVHLRHRRLQMPLGMEHHRRHHRLPAHLVATVRYVRMEQISSHPILTNPW
jgi:hypothetical protein